MYNFGFGGGGFGGSGGDVDPYADIALDLGESGKQADFSFPFDDTKPKKGTGGGAGKELGHVKFVSI